MRARGATDHRRNRAQHGEKAAVLATATQAIQALAHDILRCAHALRGTQVGKCPPQAFAHVGVGLIHLLLQAADLQPVMQQNKQDHGCSEHRRASPPAHGATTAMAGGKLATEQVDAVAAQVVGQESQRILAPMRGEDGSAQCRQWVGAEIVDFQRPSNSGRARLRQPVRKLRQRAGHCGPRFQPRQRPSLFNHEAAGFRSNRHGQ